MPEMCTVACKIPNGIFLRVFEWEEVRVASLGGHITEKRSKQVGPKVEIHGPGVPFGEIPKYIITPSGFALTPNVPRDLWRRYKEQNFDSEAIKNGLLYAFPNNDMAADASKELKDVKSGLEPLDMSMATRGDGKIAADPRVPKRADGLSVIEPSDGK